MAVHQNSPFSVIGSYYKGGRYNPPRAFGAFYAATNSLTALKEINAIRSTAAGLESRRKPPLLQLTIDYSLKRVLDLQDLAVRRLVGTTSKELRAAWRPFNARGQVAPTQSLGTIARSCGFEALLAPSKKDPQGTNIIIFVDCIDVASTVEIYDPDAFFRQTIHATTRLGEIGK